MDNKLDSNNLEAAFEIKSLRKKIQELEEENIKLKQVLKDNDLLDELDSAVNTMSNEEFICVNEIRKIKELSENGFLEEEDVRKLDILYKNLRAIRGQSPIEKDSKKTKKADVTELLKIVEGGKPNG